MKSDSPNIQNHPTSFVEDKTDSPIIYKPHTCIAEDKTDSQNIYKPPTCFVVAKKDSPKSFNRSQNQLSKLLPVSYTLWRRGPITFTSFHVLLSHDPPRGWGQAGAHLCLTEGKPATNHKTETEISQRETFPGSYSSNV